MKYLFLALTVSAHAAEIHEESITHAGAKIRFVRLQPADVQLIWKCENGEPYRTFANTQTAFAKKGQTIKFIMNAGIFEPGGVPSGLHLETGQQILPPNPKDGAGNFFLKPNGVIAFSPGKAAITSTPDWKPGTDLPRFAAQSGPLLLINGQRHPAFKNDSQNKLHRNGVGVDSKNRLVFAITEPRQVVNLWDFAGLFLKLDCQNALFLDGDISQMAVNPTKPIESNQFGAMFIVAE